MFSPNAVTICFKAKAELDCKNNYKCGKLANFWLVTINKINFKMLVVMLYTLSGLGSRKV